MRRSTILRRFGPPPLLRSGLFTAQCLHIASIDVGQQSPDRSSALRLWSQVRLSMGALKTGGGCEEVRSSGTGLEWVGESSSGDAADSASGNYG